MTTGQYPPNMDPMTTTPPPGLSVESDATHEHADGLFCDDCPEYLDQRYCTCGWSPDFRGPPKPGNAFHRHVADVLSAVLTDLGWRRPARWVGHAIPPEDQPIASVRTSSGVLLSREAPPSPGEVIGRVTVADFKEHLR